MPVIKGEEASKQHARRETHKETLHTQRDRKKEAGRSIAEIRSETQKLTHTPAEDKGESKKKKKDRRQTPASTRAAHPMQSQSVLAHPSRVADRHVLVRV